MEDQNLEQREKEKLLKYENQILYGRICRYNPKEGYGFIKTEIGPDIFVSSYNVEKEKKLFYGCVVTFKVTRTKDNKVTATEVEINEHQEFFKDIEIGNYKINTKDVETMIYLPGRENIKDHKADYNAIINNGYGESKFDTIIIFLKDGDRVYLYDSESPIKGDGQIDNLRKAYQDTMNKYISMY